MKKEKIFKYSNCWFRKYWINLYKHLITNKKSIQNKTNVEFNIKYVSAKNRNKKRKINIPGSKWLKIILMHLKKDVDVVIELIGGSDGPAKKLVFNSIKNKKHVVTANKALISNMVMNYQNLLKKII